MGNSVPDPEDVAHWNSRGSRCYGCCQENCGYNSCSCSCHPYVPPARTKPAPSLRESIKAKLGTRVMTATQLARALGKESDTVSSLLRKMVGEGEILRVADFGPRGGYGYLLKQEKR